MDTDEKIDLNRADAEALASLPGIGLKRAAQIVEYRTMVHPFEELIELAAVPGISERMVRELEGLLTVNGEGFGESAASAGASAAASIEGEPPVVVETEDDEPLPAEPPEETAEDEPPVVVTMLEEGDTQASIGEEAGPEPEPELEPAVPPSPVEVVERRIVETIPRRHFHFWQQFMGVALGAVGGSLLTLLLLFLLNGTLRFAGENRAADLQLQLDEETSGIRQSQSSLAEQMGELAGELTALDNDLAASNEAIGAVEADVAGLEEETAVINERLERIDLAAEKFDTFLNGLRDLLFALQGAPVPTATATVTSSATVTVTGVPEETADTPEMTPTPTAETPEAGGPTRTPRPTATPLIENE